VTDFAAIRAAKRQAAAVQNSLLGSRSRAISRTGGGYTNSLAGWSPRRINYREEGQQRELIANRSADLVANDPHACSLVEAISINSVGPGLWPQSKPNFKRLGISEEQAAELSDAAEWEFDLFNAQADARGITDFYGIQFENLWSVLVNGEALNLPLMIDDDPNRRYRLALQSLDPRRIMTPTDRIADAAVRDGIRLGTYGQPVAYYIANPDDGDIRQGMASNKFVEYPATVGHRPTVFHLYHAKAPEQARGVSVLAPAMSFFRNFADYLDYELMGAIVAASFPVFIEKNSPYDATGVPGVSSWTDNAGETNHYREIPPGTMLYGNPGEKPHLLKGDRPTNSFQIFVETVLRAVGAATGMPYEVVSKDFSKTNYSSARAALQEAWRVFELYQDWLIGRFCRPVWNMVFEEAVLTGRIALPKGAPGFYDAMAEYTNCTWVGPERTNVDPVKEMVADVMGLNAGVSTLADIAAKKNKDWEQQAAQRSREKQTFRALGLNPDPPTAAAAKKPETLEQDNDQ